MVGYRPRDVADQYAGATLATGMVAQRRRADRPRQGLGDRAMRIAQRGSRRFADHGLAAARGPLCPDAALAIAKLDCHRGLRNPRPACGPPGEYYGPAPHRIVSI